MEVVLPKEEAGIAMDQEVVLVAVQVLVADVSERITGVVVELVETEDLVTGIEITLTEMAVVLEVTVGTVELF